MCFVCLSLIGVYLMISDSLNESQVHASCFNSFCNNELELFICKRSVFQNDHRARESQLYDRPAMLTGPKQTANGPSALPFGVSSLPKRFTKVSIFLFCRSTPIYFT